MHRAAGLPAEPPCAGAPTQRQGRPRLSRLTRKGGWPGPATRVRTRVEKTLPRRTLRKGPQDAAHARARPLPGGEPAPPASPPVRGSGASVTPSGRSRGASVPPRAGSWVSLTRGPRPPAGLSLSEPRPSSLAWHCEAGPQFVTLAVGPRQQRRSRTIAELCETVRTNDRDFCLNV